MHYDLSSLHLYEPFFYHNFFPKKRNETHFQRYIKFINSRKFRCLEKGAKGEEHHILPTSLCPKEWTNKEINHPNNLIFLSYREHYIAHLILWKALRKGMSRAFFMLNGFSRYSEKQSSNRIFEKCKKEAADYLSFLYKGVPRSPEVIEKITKNIKKSCSTEEFKRLKSLSAIKRYEDPTAHEVTAEASKKAWMVGNRREEFSKRRKGKGNPMYGRSQSKKYYESRKQLKGSKVINNGIEQKQIRLDTKEAKDLLNEGWVIGRLPLPKKRCLFCEKEFDPGNFAKHKKNSSCSNYYSEDKDL